MKIKDLDLPEEAKDLIIQRGITSLYPPQVKTINQGLLDGENVVVAIPTASGKTLLAELAMLKAILTRGGKALYLVPLKALAAEKFGDFSEFEKLGIKVVQSTGDFDSADYQLGKFDLIICTNEKADSLLRHDTKWIRDLQIIVADEVHIIDDSSRGPTLEVVLARLKKMLPYTQILALSATIFNADEIADWLDAELVLSDWRPVKLTEGVYYNGMIGFTDGTMKEIPNVNVKFPEVNLAYDTIKNKGQVLVFANTRRNSQAAADRVGQHIGRLLTTDERAQLTQIADRMLATGEKTSLAERLAKVVRKGVAFHHAGLNPDHRKIIENSFKQNLIKCVCATPTLAAGVNLPARRVVIMSLSRYEVGMGNQPIKVLEYKQQAGRAGRPKYDKEGEAIIIAKKKQEINRFIQSYCLGEPEMIWSKLASESALRFHILAGVAIGYVDNMKNLAQFIQETFYGYQNDIGTTEFQVKNVLKFLIEEGMLKNVESLLMVTDFGQRVSQLYIDPLSAVILRDGLKEANCSDSIINEVSYFHLISATPDLRNLYLRQKDQQELQKFLMDYTDDFLVTIPEEWDPMYETFLMQLKSALLLQHWIQEKSEIAKLFGLKEIRKPLRELQIRVSHGVKKELVPLVKLKGIGRVRARMLFNHGYKTIASLRKAEPRELVRVLTIGPEIVRNIKEQLEEPVYDELLTSS